MINLEVKVSKEVEGFLNKLKESGDLKLGKMSTNGNYNVAGIYDNGKEQRGTFFASDSSDNSRMEYYVYLDKNIENEEDKLYLKKIVDGNDINVHFFRDISGLEEKARFAIYQNDPHKDQDEFFHKIDIAISTSLAYHMRKN
jgi:hypothetical protein